MTRQTITKARLREIIKEEMASAGHTAQYDLSRGDVVTVDKDSQGLKAGSKYTVVGSENRSGKFSYVVRDSSGTRIPVKYAVLKRVGSIHEAVDHKSINGIVTVASKLLAAVDAFKEKAPPAAINAVTPHLGELETMLENMVSNPGSYVPVPKKQQRVVSLTAKKEGVSRRRPVLKEADDVAESRMYDPTYYGIPDTDVSRKTLRAFIDQHQGKLARRNHSVGSVANRDMQSVVNSPHVDMTWLEHVLLVDDMEGYGLTDAIAEGDLQLANVIAREIMEQHPSETYDPFANGFEGSAPRGPKGPSN